LWTLPDGLGWALATVCGLGLLFTWWARVSIGSLWSAAVSLKQGHSVVQSGAYGLVRHPIYTGLIIAAVAQSIIIGQAANLAGAVLLTVGFWLKARLEEHFLSEGLDSSTYADYRRRTPMLIPLWPLKT
jgi:protein-S-isoprenylcysteine O-methyltransferase Ste14